MSFFYHVSGLLLCSSRPIKGLVALPATRAVDAQVWLGLMPRWLNETVLSDQQCWYVSTAQDEHGEPALTIWQLADGDYFRLKYNDSTEFIIDQAGTQVWAVWPEPLTLEDTATYLLGPVLGFVLRLRGLVCLHASAIAIGDGAIALLGPAGAGKSTTAAAFAELGYPVLSDDLVPLQEEGESFLVQPGYPCLRLWPKSVHALYGASDVLPRLTPNWDKRYLDLTANGYQFHTQPLPLAAIYLLGERRTDPATPCITAVASHAGFITLVANTHGNLLLDKAMRAQEFQLLGRVVKHVPLRRVTPHADLASLSRLSQAILDDFRGLSGSPPAVKGSGKVEHV